MPKHLAVFKTYKQQSDSKTRIENKEKVNYARCNISVAYNASLCCLLFFHAFYMHIFIVNLHVTSTIANVVATNASDFERALLF